MIVIEIPVGGVSGPGEVVESNFAIARGSAVTLAFRNAPPGDLGGTTVRFTIASAPNSRTKIFGPRLCTTPNSQGECELALSSTDTDVAPGRYPWSVRIVDVGVETLLGFGICAITPIAELP